jgi:mRNA interferase RelE/StbE
VERGRETPSRPYAVSIKKSAFRSLKKIPVADQKRLQALIRGLETDPLPSSARRLTAPGDPVYRIRSGVYRILYEVDSKAVTVLVLRVGHRGAVYDRLDAIR